MRAAGCVVGRDAVNRQRHVGIAYFGNLCDFQKISSLTRANHGGFAVGLNQNC